MVLVMWRDLIWTIETIEDVVRYFPYIVELCKLEGAARIFALG